MKIKSISAFALFVASLGFLTSCGPTQTGGYHKGAAVVACDATFQTVLEQEIQVFEYKYPGSSVLDLYVDEDAAIDSLLNLKNNVRLACTSRPLNKKEIKYLNDHKRTVNQEAIAVDAIALIVNPENPMTSIDNQDLIDILTGKYSTWDKIVPGGTSLGDIIVAFDHPGSSATRYMTDSLLNGAAFGPNVYAQGSPRAVIDLVAKNKSAIGIVGVSWLSSDLSGSALTESEMAELSDMDSTTQLADEITTSDVKVLAVQPKDKVDAYLPSQYNIFKGDYPYYRQIYLISTSAPSTVGHSFYTFVTSEVGQKVILSTGVCPKAIIPQRVEL